MNEIREDMLKVKRMVSEVEMILGKREGETELVNKLIDAENLLTYCMSRLEKAIVLPCKVGETVYVLMETSCEDIDGVYTTCEFYYANKEDLCALPKGKCPYQYRIAECVVSDINLLRFTAEWGKTVFLTREEAEKALAKRNCDIAQNIESCENCGFCEKRGASDG